MNKQEQTKQAAMKATAPQLYVVTRNQPLLYNNAIYARDDRIALTPRAAANWLASGWIAPVPKKAATKPTQKDASTKTALKTQEQKND